VSGGRIGIRRLGLRTAGLLMAVAALQVSTLPSPAAASDGVHGLRVGDGIVWHAENPFFVEWDPDPAYILGVVHFAVRGPNGDVLSTGSDPEFWNAAKPEVPPVPGVYRFEAWTVNLLGLAGPPVSIPLYFDNERPPAPSIGAPAWVAPGTTIPVKISRPTAPLPISRLDGYAVSIDQAADGSPCAGIDNCKPAEIDLPVGDADGSMTFSAPAEGISYIHAGAVSGSALRSTTSTQAIAVDGTAPAVHLDGVPSGWADGPVRLTAVADDPLSGMHAEGPAGPIAAIGVDGAPPLLTPGSTSSATVAGGGVHRIAYWARDAVGNAGDGSLPFAQPATATIRIDETDPTVRFAPRDPGDPERIEASVADPLSGPATDRGEIGIRPSGGSGRFEALSTDVQHGRLIARWDSDDYPHGSYEFHAIGFDAAGNSAASTLGADGAPFVLHNPVKRETRLAFGFGAGKLVIQRCSRTDGARRCHRSVVRSFARRPPSRAIPCCHGALVGGRLVDASGGPLGGQTVDVAEGFARGARQGTRTTAVTTDASGGFHVWLEPGPSRRVTAEFPGTRHLTRAGGRRLRLRVRAAIRLRVSTAHVQVGGPPVVFSGRIVHPEAHIPRTGLPVELEFRLPGTAWAEFRTLQTDAAGRFSYPYSFSDDDSNGVRFLFRAFVPATGDWAFAPATSRPLTIIG
jgi:hypothetical protein